MADELARLARTADPVEKLAGYRSLLTSGISSLNKDLVQSVLDAVIADGAPQQVSTSILQDVVTALPQTPSEFHLPVAEHALSRVVERAHSYDSILISLRRFLGEVYENRQEWGRAARMLSQIQFDGVSREVDDDFRLDCYVKTARFFIEDDNEAEAERFVARAAQLAAKSKDRGITLMYRVCVARVLDAKRKFEDAAIRYYFLSQLEPGVYGKSTIGEADAVQALSYAVICAILAPAGPRRSRVLAMIYNDERSRALHVYPMLESIHIGRLINSKQIEEFRPSLRPHQLATDKDNVTILDRAMTEHNVLAASKLYINIRIEELANVLEVSREKAESTAATMINEERLNASIDQVEGVVDFESPDTRAEIERWDNQIEGLCSVVDSCCDAIVAAHPRLTESM